jgi:hypothetical protein
VTVVSSGPDGVVVSTPDEVAAALDSGVVMAGVEIMTVVDDGVSAGEDAGVDSTPDEDADDSGVEAGVVSVAVTGQMVVETGMITVVRTVE